MLIFLSILALAASPAAPPVEAPAAALQEGGAAGVVAPDFTVTDHTGATVSLGELRAKGPVIMLFYRGHW